MQRLNTEKKLFWIIFNNFYHFGCLYYILLTYKFIEHYLL